jgi:hypothetical protein
MIKSPFVLFKTKEPQSLLEIENTTREICETMIEQINLVLGDHFYQNYLTGKASWELINEKECAYSAILQGVSVKEAQKGYFEKIFILFSVPQIIWNL